MRLFASIKAKQIISFAGLAIVLSAVIGVLSYAGSAGIVEREVKRTLQSNADRLAESYVAWIDLQLSNLETISAHMETGYGPELYERLEADAKRLGFNSMSPVDLSGTLHLSGGRTADLSQRAYLKKVLATSEPTVSDPVFSAVAGEENLLTVLFAVPILRDGSLIGVLVAQRNAEFLSETLKSVDYGAGASNFVMSTDGSAIAHTNIEEARKRTNPIALAKDNPALAPLAAIVQRMIAGERGIGKYTYKGVEKYVGYAPIPRLGWSAAIAAPTRTVLTAVRGLSLVILVVALSAVVVGVVLAVLLGAAFARPLVQVAKSFDDIAHGEADLTRRIDVKRKDEIGRLVESFNAFIAKLHGIMSSLKGTQASLGGIGEDLATSAHESASAISEILANIDGVRRQSDHQAKSTKTAAEAMDLVASGVSNLDTLIETQASGSVEAAASIEQMVGNIASVTSSVEKMSERFSSLMQAAAAGRVKQEAVDERVKDIASQSELLMEANEIIAGIASQTNLLAMNAAIEAAHAGEAGKGFSVVADEIRRLSETSAEQSRTIGAQLDRIRSTIIDVVSASHDSEAGFTSVTSGIDETGDLVKEIERAMGEQHEGSRQVLEALRDMNAVTAEVREKASAMNDGAERALGSMRELAEISETISGSMDEMGAGAEEINKAAQEVSALAESTNDNIRAMENAIGHFVV